MSAAHQHTIGVDIGGTKIECALVDSGGRVLASHRLPTLADDGLEAVLGQIHAGIAALNPEASTPVGVGCPGYIGAGGVVRLAVNLGWQDVPLQDLLMQRLTRPVIVENDARAALIGECQFGAAREDRHVVYLSIGTGLGAAALVDGHLLRGRMGVAMELGQMHMRNHIYLADGARLEDSASGTGLVKIANALRDNIHTPTHLPAMPTTGDILSAYEADDPLAISALQAWQAIIADAAVWMCTAFNPDALIIGGGMGLAARALLFPTLQDAIRTRCVDFVSEGLRIVPAQVESSAVGAAALVR